MEMEGDCLGNRLWKWKKLFEELILSNTL